MQPEAWFPYIGIEIEHLPRVAFTIFGFELYCYGLLIGIGFLAGTLYAVHEAKRIGQNPDTYTSLLYYVIIAAIVGARLYYVAFSWDSYKDDLLKIFAVREGGLAVYGGVLAGIATGIWFARKHKLDLWPFADTIAPGIILGQAIGRWGNFFNREAFGGYTEALFALRYLKSQTPDAPASVLEHIVHVNGADYIQVHPTFLYESFWCIVVFILMNVFKHNKKIDGSVFCLYLTGYGLGRFFIEGLRTDQLLLWGTNIAASQLLSAVWVATGIVLFILLRRKNPGVSV